MAKSRRVRTVGAVIVNPRRRKSRVKKSRLKARRNPRRLKVKARRRVVRKAARRNPRRKLRVARRRVAKRRVARRNPRRRMRASRRRVVRRARRNPRVFNASRGYRRGKSSVKAHKRAVWRRKAKRNPRVLTSRGLRAIRNGRGRRKAPRVRFMRNPRHARRRFSRRGARRNPAFVKGAQGIARKLPLIGGPLAGILGVLPLSAIGAVAVELPLRGSQLILGMGWVPEFAKKQPVYLALSGAILGALAGKFAPRMKQELQLSITAAAMGAAYFSWRQMKLANDAGIATPEQQAQAETGSDPADTVSGFGKLLAGGRPMGALSVGSQSLGMGPAYSVGPQGFGAVLIGS